MRITYNYFSKLKKKMISSWDCCHCLFSLLILCPSLLPFGHWTTADVCISNITWLSNWKDEQTSRAVLYKAPFIHADCLSIFHPFVDGWKTEINASLWQKGCKWMIIHIYVHIGQHPFFGNCLKSFFFSVKKKKKHNERKTHVN